EPSTVVPVVDEERHLGGVGPLVALVTGDSDQFVVEQGDERDPIAVIHAGEVLELALRETGPRREEPEVDRLRGLALVEAGDQPGVVGSDRTHPYGVAVAEDDVGFPRVGHGTLHRGDTTDRPRCTASATPSALSRTGAVITAPVR